MATIYTCCRCDGSGTVYVEDTYDSWSKVNDPQNNWEYNNDPVISYWDNVNYVYHCAKILSEGTGSSTNELSGYASSYSCSDCCDYDSYESGCNDCSGGGGGGTTTTTTTTTTAAPTTTTTTAEPCVDICGNVITGESQSHSGALFMVAYNGECVCPCVAITTTTTTTAAPCCNEGDDVIEIFGTTSDCYSPSNFACAGGLKGDIDIVLSTSGISQGWVCATDCNDANAACYGVQSTDPANDLNTGPVNGSRTDPALKITSICSAAEILAGTCDCPGCCGGTTTTTTTTAPTGCCNHTSNTWEAELCLGGDGTSPSGGTIKVCLPAGTTPSVGSYYEVRMCGIGTTYAAKFIVSNQVFANPDYYAAAICPDPAANCDQCT